MNKGFCGLHGLSTKKSAMTNMKARQHVNFMSNLIQHKLRLILDIELNT